MFSSRNTPPIYALGPRSEEQKQEIVESLASIVKSLDLPVNDGLRAITIFDAVINDEHGSRILGAVNDNRELALFEPLDDVESFHELPKTLAHELGHIVSPFTNNASIYKSRDKLEDSKNLLGIAALQSIITRTYLDGYHESLANAYLNQEITLEKFADETFSILIEHFFYDHSPLLKCALRQSDIMDNQLHAPCLNLVTLTAVVLSNLDGLPDDPMRIVDRSFKASAETQAKMTALLKKLSS